MKQKVEFEQVVEKGCGIDVHKKIIVATIRGTGIKEETRTFTGFTESIEEMRDWLQKKRFEFEFEINYLYLTLISNKN